MSIDFMGESPVANGAEAHGAEGAGTPSPASMLSSAVSKDANMSYVNGGHTQGESSVMGRVYTAKGHEADPSVVVPTSDAGPPRQLSSSEISDVGLDGPKPKRPKPLGKYAGAHPSIPGRRIVGYLYQDNWPSLHELVADPVRTGEPDEAYGYASRLFKFLAPQCEPLDTTLGVLTQLDNYIAGLREPVLLEAVHKSASENLDQGYPLTERHVKAVLNAAGVPHG